MTMIKIYRKGAIGALIDEYEKALGELKSLLLGLSDQQFCLINDHQVAQDFKSAKDIVTHIIRSGYNYANYIRGRFGKTALIRKVEIDCLAGSILELDEMFSYTVDTFQDKWLMTDEQILNTLIKTSWSVYDLEGLIEHAIVHVLRHRLQIEKTCIG